MAGVTILDQGPLFHNRILNPNYHNNNDFDLVTLFWQENLASNDLSGYSSTLASKSTISGNVASGPNCAVVGPCKIIALNPNSTTAAIALSVSNLPDLGQIAGKQLLNDVGWSFNTTGSCCAGRWGYYITTNSTLPTGNYNPENDKSVVMFMRIVPTGGGTLEYTLFLQKDGTQTVGTNQIGCNPNGSCFLDGTIAATIATLTWQQTNVYLNYTGTASATTGGISQNIIISGAGALTPNTGTLPWFKLTGPNYYFGLWASAGVINPIDFFASKCDTIQCQAPTIPSLQIYSFVPPPPTPPVQAPPTIDTGGFFGPIVKALISIGVFILNAIISFVGFLLPAIQGALNVIGNFFGMPGLGDQIVAFFRTVTDWFTSVFSFSFSTSLSIVTFIANGISFITITISTFFSNASSSLTAFIAIFNFLIPIWNLVVISGHISISTLISLDMFWGIMMAFRSYSEWLGWFRMNEMLFLKLFRTVYWIGDEVFKLIARIRTIGPRPAGI